MLNWKEKIIFKRYIASDIIFIIIAISLIEVFFIKNLYLESPSGLLELIGFVTIYIIVNLFVLNGFNVYRLLVKKHGKISFKELSFTVFMLSISTFITSVLLWKLDVILKSEFYIIFNGVVILLVLLNRLIIFIMNIKPSKLSVENILLVGYSEEGIKYIDEIIKVNFFPTNKKGRSRNSNPQECRHLGVLVKDGHNISSSQIIQRIVCAKCGTRFGNNVNEWDLNIYHEKLKVVL